MRHTRPWTKSFRSASHRPVGWLAVIVALAIGLATGVTGSGTGIERGLQNLSARLRSNEASGRLHIVEIDARSIAAIDRWPWSRSEHAKVVDRLAAAGATAIAFDVDFSSRSDEAGDADLAGAIDRANGLVILPTFRQAADHLAQDEVDALPAPELRNRAALAAVSVLPDNDGAVREAPMGTITAATPRPSLSAMLAGRDGSAGVSFPIDFAIDPATIPRHSFIDIRDGRFDPATLKGRQVIIGATAVEVGDRYAVPIHGVVPGVVVQALAAETLARGVPTRVGWPLALVAAGALLIGLLRCRRTAHLVVATIAAPILLTGVYVTLQAASGIVLVLAPGFLALCSGVAGIWTGRFWLAWQERRLKDEATGLPNRLALVRELASDGAGAVVVARIADYEKVVSGLSQEATAALVMRVADRIRLVSNFVRLHRIDERMLAWPATIDIEQAGDRFAALRTLMLSPVEVDGRRIDVALTIGIATRDGSDANIMIAHAALAADKAAAEHSGWHVHSRAEKDAVDRELSLLGELDEAVLTGELDVLYQPKLDVQTRRIVSVEALVRWMHPRRGYLRPDLFVPLAERNDRIAGLTLYVIQRTLRELEIWALAGHRITAAVNLSAKLISSPSFNAELVSLLKASGARPENLIFEVTESAAMTDQEAACAALSVFREMGIAISMDDYGTGQSTLSYLKGLPLNELKIDRSFVQHAHQNRGDAILVRSTINLAHELGLKVVAEGVEDRACLEFLASAQCDLAQGYLISKPISADGIAALLDAALAAAA